METPLTTQDNLPLGERLASRWLDDWRGAAVLIAVLALVSSITSLSNGFAYDDVLIILDSERLHDWRRLLRVFGESYWDGPGAPQDLYRPLILVWFGVQWAIGDGNPMVFHLVNIALYIALAVAVLGLARWVLPTRAAAVGAVIWAVHPVHVEVTGNVVGQAELVTSLAIVIAVILFLRSRLASELTWGTVVLIGLLYPIAVLTKEHGITLPGLLAVVELVLWRRGIPWSARSRSMGWLLARLLVYETVLYLGLRWAVLPSLQSVPHYAWYGLSDVQRLWGAIGLWPEVGRLLVWPARLYADYSPRLVVLQTEGALVHLVSLAMAGGWVVVGRWAWRARRPGALLGFLWFPVAFAPVANVVFPTGVLLAERTLFLPSIAVALLVGAVVEAGQVRHGGLTRIGGLFLLLLVLLGVSRSAERQRDWSDSITIFSTTVVEAPENARTQAMIGRLYLRAGAVERAGPYLRHAYELEPRIGTAYALYLVGAERCGEALVVAAEVERAGGYNEELEVARVACLLQTRRYTEARRHAARALAREMRRATYTRFVLVADSLLAASDSVDVRNRWVREGRPFSRTGAPFTIRLSQEKSGIRASLVTGGRLGRPFP